MWEIWILTVVCVMGSFSTERVSDEYVELNSCGIERFFDNDGFCMRENGRIDYHIIYVAEGVCYVTENGCAKKAPCGSVIFYPPRVRQQYSFYSEDHSVSYYIHFTGSGCERLFEKLGIFVETVSYIGKNSGFETIFENMLREYSIKLPGFEGYCSGMLIELFSVVSRYAHEKRIGTGRRKEEMILEACRKIYNDMDSVTVPKLATEFFLSTSRFSHLFRELTGKSPQEYITDMKISRACDMLVNTDLPISGVASCSGYSDQNYFSRIFRKKTGMSPKRFRQNNSRII